MNIEDLVAKYIDGSISDPELDSLRALLKSDPNAMQTLISETRLSNALSENFTPPVRFNLIKALAENMKVTLSDDELFQFKAARGGRISRKTRKEE
jgi:hypothetical protein